MKKVLVLGLALGVTTAFAATTKSSTTAQKAEAASTGETAVKLESVKPKEPTKGSENDIDQEITNAKLRAESGSKSKFSGSLGLTYQGGSLEKPLSEDRPNVTNQPVPEPVRIIGDTSLRYRFNKNQSMTLGVGVALDKPLQEAKKGNVSDPNLNYNYAGKIGSVQSVGSVGLGWATQDEEVTVGQTGTLSVGETLMAEVGTSKLSVGLAFEMAYTHYNTRDKILGFDNESGKPIYAVSQQSDYQGAAYPMMEYAFSDRVQLRTVFRPWIYRHARAAETFTFRKAPWTQSIGVGVAVTRDIYLYPNFQYNWEDWRGNNFNWFSEPVRKNSTVGLAATINMF